MVPKLSVVCWWNSTVKISNVNIYNDLAITLKCNAYKSLVQRVNELTTPPRLILINHENFTVLGDSPEA